VGALTLVCQTSVAASGTENAPGRITLLVVAVSGGRLERNQLGSSVDSWTPLSPSNVSIHACPMEFGCGRLVASSAWIAIRESPGRSDSGSLPRAL